jgi:hypothetical protein
MLGFLRPVDACSDANQSLPESTGATGGPQRALMLVAVAETSGCLGAWAGIAAGAAEGPFWVEWRHRRRLPSSARADRHQLGAAARQPGGRASAVADPSCQIRRNRCKRHAARLCHTVTQGRTLFRDIPRARLPAVAGVHRAAGRPGGPARSGRAIPTGSDQREIDLVLPEPASRIAEPAQTRRRSGKSSSIRQRPRRAELPPATGSRSRRRRARCGPERVSTIIRASSSASMAGGRLAPARRARLRSVRAARRQLQSPDRQHRGGPGQRYGTPRSYLCQIRRAAPV